MDNKELYKIAYNLHYSNYDIEKALELYKKIIQDYPDSTEAGYSNAQIENINKMSNFERKRYKERMETIKPQQKEPIKIKCPFCDNYFLKPDSESYRYSLEGNIARGIVFLPWGVIKAIKNRPYIECPHCKMKIPQG